MDPFYRYVCRAVNKRVEEDNYEHGLVQGTGVYVMFYQRFDNFEADTLPKLLEKIADFFDLKVKKSEKLFYKVNETNGEDGWIMHNRLETGMGEPPNNIQRGMWQKGKLILYNAEYMFNIERQLVDFATDEQMKLAGVYYEWDAK